MRNVFEHVFSRKAHGRRSLVVQSLLHEVVLGLGGGPRPNTHHEIDDTDVHWHAHGGESTGVLLRVGVTVPTNTDDEFRYAFDTPHPGGVVPGHRRFGSHRGHGIDQ